MGLRRRIMVLSLWFLLVFILFAGQCQGSSNTQVFQKPRSQIQGYFFGFLPKAMPIPPSGPSKQHNNIGLQNRQSP
uniref:Protein IDA-LIKE 2-like n=1 Tax=Nelumbo nucifera TaxID=4432 RepID=A0A822Z9E2_NELNU|nr:TPA_asm: hypothetical protein HUJ06_014322 [Nelumbo nucifera]